MRRRGWSLPTLGTALLLLLGGPVAGPGLAPAQMGITARPAPPAPPPAPPFDLQSQAVIQEGSVLFATTCSYCHKRNANPGASDAAPSLRDRPYEKEYLYKMIAEGPPSRRMPAWKFQYSSEQIWKLVAYIMSVSGRDGPPR